MPHEFSLIVTAPGLDPDSDIFDDQFVEFCNRAYEAGCGDALIVWQRGALVFDFARAAETFDEAVASAIKDVESLGTTARLQVRYDPED